jgi:trehalose utilization protein
MIRVTVWNEFIEENMYEEVHKVYPEGIHNALKGFLSLNDDMQVRCVTLDSEGQGLSEEILNQTDVLIWWGHQAHDKVTDENAQRVKRHVLNGMGFIALHSAHCCKPLRLLLGTTMSVRWKHGQKEKLICINPSHPIAEGITEPIFLDKEEMYGEFFDIPKPDDIVFLGWFSNQEVFRSGCTFFRGNGKIFYFQPGHEEYPIYYQPQIQKIITNAVRYVVPVNRRSDDYQSTEVK